MHALIQPLLRRRKSLPISLAGVSMLDVKPSECLALMCEGFGHARTLSTLAKKRNGFFCCLDFFSCFFWKRGYITHRWKKRLKTIDKQNKTEIDHEKQQTDGS